MGEDMGLMVPRLVIPPIRSTVSGGWVGLGGGRRVEMGGGRLVECGGVWWAVEPDVSGL